jgi:rubredoxin
MISEFSAAYQSLSTILKLAKAVHDAATQVEKNQILLEMQGALLELQAKLSAMQQKIDELTEAKRSAEAKLDEFSNWAKEAEKYQLSDLGGRANVMVCKPEFSSEAADHWLCPNCFEKKEKSYLQFEGSKGVALISYKCARCGYSILITSGMVARKPRVIR